MVNNRNRTMWAIALCVALSFLLWKLSAFKQSTPADSSGRLRTQDHENEEGAYANAPLSHRSRPISVANQAIDESKLQGIDTDLLFLNSGKQIAPIQLLIDTLKLTKPEIAGIENASAEAITSIRDRGKSLVQKGPEGDGTAMHYDFMPLPAQAVDQLRGEFVIAIQSLLGEKRSEVFMRYFDLYGKEAAELRGFGRYKLQVSFSTRSPVFGPGISYTELLYDDTGQLLSGAVKQSNGLPEHYKGIFNVLEK